MELTCFLSEGQSTGIGAIDLSGMLSMGFGLLGRAQAGLDLLQQLSVVPVIDSDNARTGCLYVPHQQDWSSMGASAGIKIHSAKSTEKDQADLSCWHVHRSSLDF